MTTTANYYPALQHMMNINQISSSSSITTTEEKTNNLLGINLSESISYSESSSTTNSTVSPLRTNMIQQYQKHMNESAIGISQHSIPDESYRKLLFNTTDGTTDNETGVLKAGYHRLKSLLEDESSVAAPTNILSILTNQPLYDEFDAVQQEILRTNVEIKSMEEDYDRIMEVIDCKHSNLKQDVSRKNLLNILAADDYHYINNMATSLDHKTKSKMRKARGLHFRVKIGGDVTNQQDNDHFNEARLSKVAFLSRCGSASRARTVTYVSLISQAGFFIRRENGKWYVHGIDNLPINLQKRLIEQEQKGYELRYLSVGPTSSQCYYAEWSNGDCYWVNFDNHFHEIVKEYPVHRIAFGNLLHKKPSWIVISKDGRSAWSGIPSRLANTLKNRDPSLPAPCEVSLGPGGSYFIKFLDGDTDYILPAVVANECEDVERNGGKVTNVSLHMDCYDFIIRHTETSKVKRGEVVIHRGGKNNLTK